MRLSPRPDERMDYPVVPPPSHVDGEPVLHHSPTASATSWGSTRPGMPMPRVGGSDNGMDVDSDGDGIRVVGLGDHVREEQEDDQLIERCMRAEKKLERRRRELSRLMEDPTVGEYDLQIARNRVERAEDEVTGAWMRREERRRF